MLKTSPAVFAVGNNYQIMVEVTKESLFSVKIGEDEYFDESNGIMNSLADIHRVSVPMEKLDNAKSIALEFDKVIYWIVIPVSLADPVPLSCIGDKLILI